jgi:hypothetical protein
VYSWCYCLDASRQSIESTIKMRIIPVGMICLVLLNHAGAKDPPRPRAESRKLGYELVEAAFGNTATFVRNGESPVSQAPAYEWSGVFETPDRMHTWSAQRVNGEYADTSMKLVVLSAPNATAEALKDLHPTAQRVFGQRCRPAQYRLVKAGGTITPDNDTCYMMDFDPDAWQTLFKVRRSPPLVLYWNDSDGVLQLAYATPARRILPWP